MKRTSGAAAASLSRLRILANAGLPFVAALLVLIALVLWRVAVLEDASEREDRADRTLVLAATLRANIASLQSIDREFLLTGLPHRDRPRVIAKIDGALRDLPRMVDPSQLPRLNLIAAEYYGWRMNSEQLMRGWSKRRPGLPYSRSELREPLAHSLNYQTEILMRTQRTVRTNASHDSDNAARSAVWVTVVSTLGIGSILAMFVWSAMLRAQRARERLWEESRASQEAQEAARIKSEFVAHMSHELRTPLTAILGLSEMLYDDKAGPTSDVQKAYLNDIIASGRHLLDLINEVLDLAKLEAGKLVLSYEVCNPRSVAQQVVDTLSVVAESKHIDLRTNFDGAPTSIVADTARLRQVLYNYISNALKFTPPHGSVAVRMLSLPNERYRIEVQDTGIGIGQDELPHLFRGFSQLNAQPHDGAGLGLALTKRIVESQGGIVGVTSKKGAGSTFFAELPCAPATADFAVGAR